MSAFASFLSLVVAQSTHNHFSALCAEINYTPGQGVFLCEQGVKGALASDMYAEWGNSLTWYEYSLNVVLHTQQETV